MRTRQSPHFRILVPAAALALGLAACTGGTAAPTAAPAAKTAAPTSAPAAAGSTSGRMEVQVVSAVRPKIDAMTAALKSANLAAAMDAYEAYDAAWNGIEVYVNFRSKPMYDKLEGDLQNQLEEGLAKPQPDFAGLAAVSEQLGQKFDETIALVTSGAPLSPLFDDVTNLRMIRSDLRIATAAIAANNVAKAKAHWDVFKTGLPAATDLIKVRTAATIDELNAAVAAADAAFGANASADALKPLVAAVTTRYNFGVSLWNAAARNADPAKKTYSADDLQRLADLNAVATPLRKSLAAWQASDYATAATSATAATTAFAAVQPALAAHNGADATLKTALEAYAPLAAAAGDAAKVAAANRTALDAIAVAQQVFVGQFWSDPTVQAKLTALATP